LQSFWEVNRSRPDKQEKETTTTTEGIEMFFVKELATFKYEGLSGKSVPVSQVQESESRARKEGNW